MIFHGTTPHYIQISYAKLKAAFTEPDTVVVPDNTRAQSDPNLASGTETANEHYRVNCIGPS